MKQWKFFAMATALILSVGLLSACNAGDDGKEPVDTTPAAPPAYSDVWPSEESPYHVDVPTTMTELSELKGFSVTTPTSSDGEPLEIADYAVLTKQDSDTGLSTYKIYSYRTGTVTATFSESMTETVQISYRLVASENTPTFKVTKAIRNLDDGEETMTYSLYDVTGQELLQRKSNFTLTESTVYPLLDWVVFENNVYTVNEETGSMTLKGKLPFLPDLDGSYYRNDQYIYMNDYDGGVVIYDYDFNLVASRILPANATDMAQFVLSNGNVLIQYRVELHPDAVEYDLYEWKEDHILKYSLVTEIFSVADKTIQPLALPFAVTQCLSDNVEDKSGYTPATDRWAEGFENLVMGKAIVNKQVSDSDADYVFYAMANDGTVGHSYKLVEGQDYHHMPLGNGYYAVNTVFGMVVTDATGKVLANIGELNIEQVVDRYFITEYCIYDTGLNTLCDFADENAEYIGAVGNTVFVSYYATDDSGDYTIMAFRDGSKTEIYSYDADAIEQNYFGLEAALGFYYIANPATGERTFYNGDGQKVGTLLGNVLETYRSTDSKYILAQIRTDDDISYYVIK